MGKENKRDIVTRGGGGKGRKFVFSAVLLLAVLAVAGIVMNGRSQIGVKQVRAVDGVVSVPVSDLEDGKAKYYSYSTPHGKVVKFFILRSSDGVIRAAFDACDVCYEAKLGYRQEGDAMVCNNCGQVFPSTKINELRGGCNPSPIARETDGRQIIIRASDIEQGVVYF